MDFIEMASTVTPVYEIAGRLMLAIVFGALVGIDREYRNRPAGLRTHVLTSLTAALFMIITYELAYEARDMGETIRADPIRVIEAITAGVAFLAAGTIIRSGDSVTGLTTGASMWLAGAVGVACGGGYYAIAFLAIIAALIVLVLLGWAERHMPRQDENPLKQKRGSDD